MKQRLKPAIITGLIFAGFSFIGNQYVGGDGFFADPNQAPVGSSPAGVISSFIFGAILGYIPWRSILRSIFKK